MVSEYDVLVVGGGSSGCALAGRLSEDPALRVALVEAGGDGDNLLVNVPFNVMFMLPRALQNWAFQTVPQPGLNMRRGYQPRGKALGGSSAMNAMIYVRGHPSDYDHWASLGNAGWSWNDVLPLFKRAEHNERGADALHGTGGPLNVADLRSDVALLEPFRRAAQEAGFPLNDDFNGAEQEGLGPYQVTQKDGERCSAARAYLQPHLRTRTNLAVFTRTRTLRLLLEAGRAVGIEVLREGRREVLRARREVVLCAGAFQSPQLLMLSGIGDPEALARVGLPVVHALPGVGRNLQDHVDFVFGYGASAPEALTLAPDGIVRVLRDIGRWRRERRGVLTTNFAEYGGFLRLSPDSAAPDIQLHFVIGLLDDHARKTHFRRGLGLHVCLLRPKSRGSVTLASPDPMDAPLIDPKFYDDPDDLERMVAGFRMARRLMEAPALARLLTEDVFTAGVQSDAQVREVLRARSDTVYHPVGTCRMGSDAYAVVDAELRVHGIGGLRVADASIMPTIVGGNTNAPCIMIGEKAADLIRATA